MDTPAIARTLTAATQRRARLVPLLFAGTLLAGFPAPALAQSVLVSNIGQAEEERATLGSTSELAQAFTTGTNATGYTLTGIELRLYSLPGATTPPTR